MRRWVSCVVLTLAVTVVSVHADVWDTASDTDDTAVGTDNELVHGSQQLHDLAVHPGPTPDQDWFKIWVPSYSSFEVVFDAIGGDLDLWQPGAIQRFADDGVTVAQEASGVTIGALSMRLAWQNTTGSPQLSYIRVTSLNCGVACSTGDSYRIVARETTVFVARFNNSGTQTTVVLSQNASPLTVNAVVNFWSAAGALLHTESLTSMAGRALSVLSSAGVPALAGKSGSVTVSHDAPYGTFNVKAVALEPSTGFSFDSPGVIRPW